MVSQIRRRPSEGSLITRPQFPWMEMRRRLDALFDRFFGGEPEFEEFGEPVHFWDIDVSEGENEVALRADLPGFESNELDVQFNDNLLTIAAEHREKTDGRERHRRYRRTVALPWGLNADKIQATYRNGVLELHIPRSEEAKPKRVQVRAEGGSQPQIQTQQGAKQKQSQSASAK